MPTNESFEINFAFVVTAYFNQNNEYQLYSFHIKVNQADCFLQFTSFFNI